MNNGKIILIFLVKMMEEFLLARTTEVLGELQISKVVNLALRLFHINYQSVSWESQDTPRVGGMQGYIKSSSA